jgi:hypothetical protein
VARVCVPPTGAIIAIALSTRWLVLPSWARVAVLVARRGRALILSSAARDATTAPRAALVLAPGARGATTAPIAALVLALRARVAAGPATRVRTLKLSRAAINAAAAAAAALVLSRGAVDTVCRAPIIVGLVLPAGAANAATMPCMWLVLTRVAVDAIGLPRIWLVCASATRDLRIPHDRVVAQCAVPGTKLARGASSARTAPNTSALVGALSRWAGSGARLTPRQACLRKQHEPNAHHYRMLLQVAQLVFCCTIQQDDAGKAARCLLLGHCMRWRCISHAMRAPYRAAARAAAAGGGGWLLLLRNRLPRTILVRTSRQPSSYILVQPYYLMVV